MNKKLAILSGILLVGALLIGGIGILQGGLSDINFLFWM